MLKKKVLSGLLAIAMVFGSAAALPESVFDTSASITASAETSGDYSYQELDDETVEITKYSGSYTMINIPSTLGGKQVTSIGSDAFSDRAYLEKIIIPSSVTNIAEKAFASAPGLKKITIPNSVKAIGDNAFNSKCTIICTKSSFAYVYAALYSIKCEYIAGDYIYKDIDDETVEITGYTGKDKTVNIPSTLAGKTVTSIGDYAFNAWSSLTSITIPNSVTSIGDYAFSRSGLTSITIPNSVTRIGEFAFGACYKLESAVIPTGVETITYDLFAECRGLKSVTIPSSVKSIENGAFSNCSALTSITIPSNVTYIGASAFEGCTGLKSLTIPSSVETIDDYAFGACGFTSLTVPKTVTKIGKMAIGYVHNELYCLVKDDNFTVKCYKGTAAEKYAKDNGFKIEYIGLKHIAAKAATCTADGNIEYWKYDGKFYSDAKLTTEITQAKTVVKATGHKWGTPSWTWNGTASASAKFVCSNDKSHVETVKAAITSKTTKATCTTDGKAVYTATVSFNGKTYTNTNTVTIPKTGHKFSAWKTTAFDTDKNTSTQTRTCSACNKTESRTIENAIQRLAGAGRYETAAKISRAEFTQADTVVLANSMNYADALAGVPLAKAKNAPILLTTLKTLPAETLAEIERLNAKKVIILGGTSAVSADVEKALTDKKLEVERIAGKTRFETATKIADKMQQQNENKAPTDVFFVYYNGFADALSVSAAAAVKGAPIVYLTTNGALNPDTAAYIADLKKAGSVKNAYVIGGTGVISDDMMKKAGNALGVAPTRLFGANRFETCIAVNEKFAGVLNGNMLCVATGMDFPDALAGGVYAAIN
ncbi:MAG: leucine-rich repeat protein, partial [Ruminococcus sp.]|nr:leucine-rich repeat protein [Ruminococcus sp.]